MQLENDATVIDAVVQHLASKSDKARQAAIFAVSRIACFQANCSVARHFLRLLGHSNPEVRQVAQAALGHVIPKGSEISKTVLKDISALLVHHDRNMREAAVDAVVQVSCDYEALRLTVIKTYCYEALTHASMRQPLTPLWCPALQTRS